MVPIDRPPTGLGVSERAGRVGRTATLSQAEELRPCGRWPTAGPPDGHAGAMYVSVRVDARRRWALREEVGRLRARESRRVFDPSVHVGILGGGRAGFVLRAKDGLA